MRVFLYFLGLISISIAPTIGYYTNTSIAASFSIFGIGLILGLCFNDYGRY